MKEKLSNKNHANGSMLRHWIVSLMSVVVMMNAYLAVAEAAGLDSQLEQYLVTVDKKGKENLTPAVTVEPGQIMEYRLIYTNQTDKPFKKLVINGPIPENTTYVAGSANSKVKNDLRVSVDGGQTFEQEPVVRKIQQPDGTVKDVIIPPEKYTHLRWDSHEELPGGKKHEYTYRVKVN